MPARTTYGIDLRLELAIGRSAETGVWDTGVFDLARWGDVAEANWIDVTCDVPGVVNLSAGTDNGIGAMVQWEAAALGFNLLGAQWDPWNGPYAGLLTSRLPVRLLYRNTPGSPGGGAATWRAVFTGRVIDGGWDWDPRSGRARVACADATAELVAYDGLKQAPVGASEQATDRVARVAANARFPYPAPVPAQGVRLVATTLEKGAWAELVATADTDLALLYLSRAGNLTYISQGRLSPPRTPDWRLVACAPAGPDDVQVLDMTSGVPIEVVNIVSARAGTPPGGADPAYVTHEDSTSTARFGPRRQTLDLLVDGVAHPTWPATVADAVLASQAWPAGAPHDVTLGIVTGDYRVPRILVSLQPADQVELVDPGGRSWLSGIAGWDVELGYDTCVGRLLLNPLPAYAGTRWDQAQWDEDQWGLGTIGA